MDLDHIGDHLTTGQTVVDPVGSLTFPITDICAVITCSETAFFRNSFSYFFDKDIQMSAARITVSISTFNNNLNLSQVLFVLTF